MFGGDEVNSLVIDIGSSTVKAGYGGDDAPKAVYPSSVGVLGEGDGRRLLAGSQAINYRRDGMEITPCFGDDGAYADWDVVDALWEHAFTDRLRLDPKEHPMMLAEPTPHPDAARERTVELMFEKHAPPALFLARDAVLASFATGRQSAIVVDAGHDSTTVAAVHDGFLLHKSVTRTPLGGAVLTSAMAAAAAARAPRGELAPAYAFSRREVAPGDWVSTPLDVPGTTDSYKAYAVAALAADIKETACRVHDAPFDAAANASMPTASYDLPDGTTLELGPDRLNVPECLFQPRLLAGYGLGGIADRGDCVSLPDAVMKTLAATDSDLRRDLLGAVVLSGGGALLTGLRDRLEREVGEAARSLTPRVKVVCPANTVERRFGVWIGGSILASLGSFQQMWMSKADYEEHGKSLIHRRAP